MLLWEGGMLKVVIILLLFEDEVRKKNWGGLLNWVWFKVFWVLYCICKRNEFDSVSDWVREFKRVKYK